ncbi:MAG: HAMP domain-containing histidine kinase, partial [Campylobacterales bacterium]|nr:HAMP domain-containing histidine kinase [Campylobacterales bacterium]
KNAQLQRNKKSLQSKIKEQVAIITQEKALIRQQSKMAEMGNMIGAITHQWKQPINVISTLIADLQIKSMMQQPKPNDCNECYGLKDKLVNRYLDNINLEVNYMNQTIEDFKNFLKPSKEKTAYSITAQVQRVERILSAVLQKNSVTLTIVKEAQNDTIYGYPTEFAQVILNLVSNAKDAIITNNPDNRNIDITISQNDEDIEIVVQDYAGGIEQKDMESIFKDYYTTKGEQGTGLGLSIVQEIITNMDGEIKAKNKNGGACFIITMRLDNHSLA